MELSEDHFRQAANLGRKLAQAPGGAAIAAELRRFVRLHAKSADVRMVCMQSPALWREWSTASRKERVRRAFPNPPSRGTAVFFDPANTAAGFIWTSAREAPLLWLLQLLAPHVWTAMMLRAALDRARDVSIHEERVARASLKARDEERRRIARELHDDLGQTMASLKLNLQWAENAARRGGIQEVASELAESRASIGIVLQKIRDLSHTLYPRVLETSGLAAAVRELLQEATRRTRIKFTFSAEGNESRITPETAGALYRCCQEIVHNVLRHSGATRIDVRIVFSESEVSLLVEDNGKGFDPSSLYSSGVRTAASGFWSIRQRVADLRGALRVGAAQRRGAAIEIVVPYTSHETSTKRKNQNRYRR